MERKKQRQKRKRNERKKVIVEDRNIQHTPSNINLLNYLLTYMSPYLICHYLICLLAYLSNLMTVYYAKDIIRVFELMERYLL